MKYSTTLGPTEVMALWCCRCGKKNVGLNRDQLEEYDRESRVVLCIDCRQEDS